jgi:Mg-chelatase subunit ChlD
MNDVLRKRITGKSPMHMVLIADDSGSMKGPPSAAATTAIHAWVNELYVKTRGRKPYFQFSLVSFGSIPTIVVEKTDVRDIDVTSFVLQGGSGYTNLADALATVRQILARDGATADHCPPFVFLFTDGKPTEPNGQTSDAAAQAAQDAATALKMLPLPCGSPFVVALGFGNVSDSFLQQVASAPQLYHRIPNAQALIQLLPEIGTPTVEGAGEEGTVGAFLKQAGGGITDL